MGALRAPSQTGVPKGLAMRTTVFMLDEFRTSKRCPGGCGSVIKDVEGDGGYRMRRCSNVSNAGVALLPENCQLWVRNNRPFVCNGDESATVHIITKGEVCLRRFRFVMLVSVCTTGLTPSYLLMWSLRLPMINFPHVLHAEGSFGGCSSMWCACKLPILNLL